MVKPYTGPCIVIVGPTGSGKTGVAIEIAQILAKGLLTGTLGDGDKRQGIIKGAEIISADSRAIYRHMNIGTAKPTKEEQDAVVHYGLDLVEPGERYTVADWKQMAEQKIDEIRKKGKVPIVVGGTGLYVDALVFNYQFRGKTGEKAAKGASSEQKMCSDRQNMLSSYVVFGIKWDMNELKDRLAKRIDKLFIQDLYDETKLLVERYGWGSQAMTSDIYQFAWGYLQGEYSLEEAKRLCLYQDYHLAKRQMTWFKRNPKIIWLPLDKIKPAVIKCIQDG